jgi:DNA-directed RNA polymerase subunit beta
LVQNDIFTSIHIEEFETTARDTKLGKEEVTRDIPNAGNENLRNLDEAGIIRIGAYVKSGDILVGKVTPKGESQPTPEEKLLRAIFGEKAEDVKDSSLRAKTGAEGVVINAQVFARQGADPDSRSLQINEKVKERIERDRSQNEKVLKESGRRRLIQLLDGNVADQDFEYGDISISKGEVYSPKVLEGIPFHMLENLTVADNPDLEDRCYETIDSVNQRIQEANAKYQEKIDRLGKGDELPPGVIKKVNVYVAIKRKLQVGDKMAGRHGNKGVVSRIMPVENMPYLENGTPVDVVLNPLGVPSRMNVGQILETHLGWAARGIGYRLQEMLEERQRIETIREFLMNAFDSTQDKNVVDFLSDASDEQILSFAHKYEHGVNVSTPVFAGAAETKIKDYLEHAGYERDGQTILYDGRTGEPFKNRVTVGVMYVLKLHHLVDEKIHARSTGPYSLVTQQPLGGKAQNGGQRLGEMEVWALEAYGAAYSLQEFLTVKSDDVLGRTRMYQSIVKGDNSLDAGLPESFNVLVRELKSLAIDVELTKNKDIPNQ